MSKEVNFDKSASKCQDIPKRCPPYLRKQKDAACANGFLTFRLLAPVKFFLLESWCRSNEGNISFKDILDEYLNDYQWTVMDLLNGLLLGKLWAEALTVDVKEIVILDLVVQKFQVSNEFTLDQMWILILDVPL